MTAAKKTQHVGDGAVSKENESDSKSDLTEVNVDALTVKILLLVKSTAPQQQAASYLTRRGWPTTVESNLNKAIAYIAQHKPDYVFISLNHPNPNIIRLPLLLENTFKTTCIGFSEQGDSATMVRLKKAKITHKMNQMASGTSIQRMVRKLLMEKYGQTDSEGTTINSSHSKEKGNSWSSLPKDNQDNTGDPSKVGNKIRISGSEGQAAAIRVGGEESAGGGNHWSGGENSAGGSGPIYSSRKKQPYTLESEPIDPAQKQNQSFYQSGAESSFSPSHQSGADTKAERGLEDADLTTQQLMDLILNNRAEQDANEARRQEQKAKGNSAYWGEGKDEPSSDMSEEASRAGKGPVPFYQDDERASENSARRDQGDGRKGSEIDINAKKKGSIHAASESSSGVDQSGSAQKRGSEASLADPSARHHEPQDANAAEANSTKKAAQLHEPVRNSKKGRGKASHHDPYKEESKRKAPTKSLAATQGSANRDLSEEETSLYKSIYSALESLESDPTSDAIELAETPVDTMGVIPLETGEELHGFIIICMSRPELMTNEGGLIDIEELVAEKMRLKGEENVFDESFFIRVPPVNFTSWANEHAAFTFTHAYQGAEMGVAFLPTKNRFPCRRSSKVENMAKINLDDISPSRAVTFKAYLHLEKNNKQLLYLKDGRMILQRQKESLKSNDFTDFHIKEDDINKFKAYLATTVINELIESFED